MALTDEQKEKARANLALAREKRKAVSRARGSSENEPVKRPEDEMQEPVGEPVSEPDMPDSAAPLTLSEDELEKVRLKARAEVERELANRRAEERKVLMAKTLDEEMLRQRTEAGLIDYRDDMLEILIDVAPFADHLAIDGVVYQHARWYTVDRRKYDVLREMMARSWDAEDRAGNPNRKFRREAAGTMNPMARERRMPDGTLTIGLDTRVNAMTGGVAGLPIAGR